MVNGACAEPADLTLQRPAAIDQALVRLMERLLEAGGYPAIATHAPALFRATRGVALRMGLASNREEYQMPYGVRCEAQVALRRDRYRVRIYAPFGMHWS
jgi:proline dehydrogenase